MAQLPSGADLRKSIATNATPGIRVGQVDYSPLAQGNKAIGEGIGAIAKGGQGLALELQSAQTDVDDFETKRRLLDFKDASEKALEEYKRTMPPGGGGYADGWQGQFKDLSREFVGDKDSNIPQSQRAKVGLALRQWQSSLYERAWRDENAEKDRSTLEGLETTVTSYRSRVEADPGRLADAEREIGQLIEMSPLTPATKDAYRKKALGEYKEAAAYAWANSVRTAEDRARVKALLAPDAPDKRSGGIGAGGLPQSYLDQIKKSEGFTSRATWDYKQSSNGYGTRARSPGEVIDKAEAETRFNTEIGAAAAEVDKFAPGLPAGPRAALTSLTFNAGSSWMTSGLGQAVQAGDWATARERFAQYTKAGGEDKDGLVTRRRTEVAWFGDQSRVEPDATGDDHTGPLAGMPLAKRRAVWAHAEQVWGKQIAEAEKAIKSQMNVAEDGLAPPAGMMEALAQRVASTDDIALRAQYDALVRKVGLTQGLQKAPPAAAEDYARQLRTDLEQNGATKEQDDAVKHAEKVAASIRKNVDSNPMGWAAKTGITVPLADGPPADLEPGSRDKWQMPTVKVSLQQLDFNAADIDTRLSDRIEQAKGVARYYSQPVQMFTPAERDAMRDYLKTGGPPMLHVLGRVAAAAGQAGVDPALVMKEVTKDAPEVARIGTMVAEGAEPRVLETAAKALSWKHQMGEKFESTIDKAAAKPDLAEYAEVLSTKPSEVDNVKHLANLVYEYEARTSGEKQFNPTRYRDVVARIMGETTGQDGVKYGGVNYQNGSWFDGKAASQVQVPAGVRSDSFDVLLGALRSGDFAKTGMPRTRTGEPLTIQEIRNATWVSVGPGQYWIQQSRGTDGKRTLALDEGGRPFVMDLRPVLGNLKTRKPSIFQGWDRMTGIEPPAPADPALPSFWTGAAKDAAPAAAKSNNRVKREAVQRMIPQ